jgi:hypothetical protein
MKRGQLLYHCECVHTGRSRASCWRLPGGHLLHGLGDFFVPSAPEMAGSRPTQRRRPRPRWAAATLSTERPPSKSLYFMQYFRPDPASVRQLTLQRSGFAWAQYALHAEPIAQSHQHPVSGLCCKGDRRIWEDGDKLDPISFMRRYRKER